MHDKCRGFKNIFSWKVTGCDRQAKHFELNFFQLEVKKIPRSQWPKQASKIVLTDGQLAQNPALDKTFENGETKKRQLKLLCLNI